MKTNKKHLLALTLCLATLGVTSQADAFEISPKMQTIGGAIVAVAGAASTNCALLSNSKAVATVNRNGNNGLVCIALPYREFHRILADACMEIRCSRCNG